MKAENQTTPHGRTIRITEINQDHPNDPTEILIEIRLVESNVHNAVQLDHRIIPTIIAGINEQVAIYQDRLLDPTTISREETSPCTNT